MYYFVLCCNGANVTEKEAKDEAKICAIALFIVTCIVCVCLVKL